MAHNEYWKSVWETAHKRLHRLFADSKTKVEDIVEDENGVDSYCDAKKVLAFVYDHRHSATPEDMACATLSVVEALQALHELKEHEVVK